MSAVEYTIVDQLPTTRVVDGNRGVAEGYDVVFRDAVTGVTGQVFVPNSHYTADSVRTLILDRLQHIRMVHDLTD